MVDVKVPPHDREAEESLIGAMLLDPAAIVSAMEIVNPEDFYDPTNSRIYQTICAIFEAGIQVDGITVSDHMDHEGLAGTLSRMMLNVPYSAGAPDWARIIVKHSRARVLMSRFRDVVNCLQMGEDPYEQADRAEKLILSLGSSSVNQVQSQTIEELIDDIDNIAPVVIPGMMNQDFRTIIVGSEGSGKSVLLRHIAMCVAQGVHPFKHNMMDSGPARALIVDLENPRAAVIETARTLMGTLMSHPGVYYDPDRLRIYRKPGGINIRRRSDRAELEREIAFQRPRLVVAGPIYKSYQRVSGESYEDSADEAMAAWDYLRTKYEFALILEHHAAKAKSGEKREMTPMGSQRWLAWPETGLSLTEDKDNSTIQHVGRFRGDRLHGISWPDRLIRNKVWLFDGVWDKNHG